MGWPGPSSGWLLEPLGNGRPRWMAVPASGGTELGLQAPLAHQTPRHNRGVAVCKASGVTHSHNSIFTPHYQRYGVLHGWSSR